MSGNLKLQQKSIEVYLVGGAVRDGLLNLPVKERDWVVVGATGADMLELGFEPVPGGFPVYLDPQKKEEYALARIEEKTGTGYKGFAVKTDASITLEQDLKRRDITINAMAQTDSGEVIDPFHGKDDLNDGLLRHVSEAFVEDPVRLLRIARFAAVLGEYGFHVAHPTFKLMKQMVNAGELKTVSSSIVWKEMKLALGSSQPWQFFKILGKCGALDQLVPGINDWVNGVQMAHGKDSDSITALKEVSRITNDKAIRLGVLLYQALTAGNISFEQNIVVDKDTQRLILAIKKDASRLLDVEDASALLGLIEKNGFFQQKKTFQQLLAVLSIVSDESKKIESIASILPELLAIKADEFTDAGLKGQEISIAVMQKRTDFLKSTVLFSEL